MRAYGRIGCVLAVTCAGCAAQPAQEKPGEEHGHVEMRATGTSLVDEWHREGDFVVSPPLDAAEGATRVGVLLATHGATAMPRIEARLLAGERPLTEWTELGSTWDEVDQHVATHDFDVTGDGAQLRIDAGAIDTVSHLRWTAVVPDAPEEVAAPEGELGAGREALRAELSGLGIVTREAWGARATRCTARDTTKTRMAVHYTVTPATDPERQVRAIQRYHMDSRGWCDVGYHFLVGVDGTIYEGRPLHLLGAHVGGNNTHNIGVSFVGCFHGSGCSSWPPQHPPDAMISAGARLLGELSRLYDIPLDRTHVKGHRDHPGASTTCPGDYLHARIDDMLAEARTPPPADDPPPDDPPPPPPPEEDPPAGPPPGASCTHSYGGVYANTACSPGYQCCDGRWRVRGSTSACGACYCVEETGSTGCGT